MSAASSPHLLARTLTRPADLNAQQLSAVLSAGLGGAVRSRLPQDHPLRGPLRQQALDLAMRHARIRAELHPLLEAWSREGIPVLLFKGFAMAEFEYTTAGERFYGDVDLLLPDDPATVFRAAHIAMAHGWRSDGLHADPDRWTHETMHLYGPGGSIGIDVHRWIVSAATAARSQRLRELTSGVWRRAIKADWPGLSVFHPSPLDTVAILVIGRSWGGDSGGLKPADYLDLQVLQEKYGLSAEQQRNHMRELGALNTWDAFCALCSPQQSALVLEVAQTRPLLSKAIARDGLSARRGYYKGFTKLLFQIWTQLPEALGDVLAAWWALRHQGDPRQHLQRWTPSFTRWQSRTTINRRLTAVRWWTRLLYPRQSRRGVCVPRAYASYRSLRRLGHPAVFVSGAGRHDGALLAHAWVEDIHGPLEEYGEPLNRQRFHEVFSYPPHPEAL